MRRAVLGTLLVFLIAACPTAMAEPTGGTTAGPPPPPATPEGGVPGPAAAAPAPAPAKPVATGAAAAQQEEPAPDEQTGGGQQEEETGDPIDVGVPQDELGGEETAPVPSSGGLPSTGFAALLVAGAGLVLLLTGLATRRSAGSRRHAS